MNISTRAVIARVRNLILTFSLFSSIFCSFPPAAYASTTSASLAITEISVTSVPATPLSAAQHQVVLSGTFLNNSNIFTSPNLELVIANPLSSRSAVLAAVKNDEYSGLSNHPEINTKLINIPPHKTSEWQLSFNGDDFFSNEDPVAVFGVRISGTKEQVVIPRAWYFKQGTKPTSVALAVPVTTSAFNQVGKTPDLSFASKEINRLISLLDSAPKQATLIIDPYLRSWLLGFAGTDLDADATLLNRRLNKYIDFETVYAQTDLFRVYENKLTNIFNRAISSENNAITIYSPNKDSISKNLFQAVGNKKDALMILPNDVFGSEQQTMTAHGISNATDFLIGDAGLAECFNMSDKLLAQTCLTSMLTAITAESPNRARCILLEFPLLTSSVQLLNPLTQPAEFNNNFEIVNISAALSATPVAHSIPQGPVGRNQLSTSMRRGLTQLQNLSNSVDAVFDDAKLSAQLDATRFFALSTFSDPNKENLALVSNAVAYATQQLQTLTLQGSSRITIPGTKADLPITIVNGSEHTATVGIQISSPLPGRISASNIDAVVIEPGNRMTVAIPITVSGAGLISIRALLTSRNNDTFGTPLPIQIASSAYQNIARNLVWTALALLVILLANSVRKRRKSI